MKPGSILAIYVLFWWTALFVVLPFRLRSSQEPEAFVAGQVESATPRFSVWRTTLWTTIVATVSFGLFYLNFRYGWVTADFFDLTWLKGRSI